MLRDAVLMALMMLLCTMPSYSALTEGEIDALGAILESWPTLHDFPLPSGQPWQRNNISHACENHFYGVNCSDGADPHVKSLDFQDIQLGGTIPDAVGRLPFLEQLRLERTGLSGTISNSLFGSSVLQTFVLRDNGLVGSLPDSMYRATSLNSIEINENQLSGEIREEIGQLTNLRRLDLRSSPFSGRIPSSIGNLRELTYLNIASTRLEGPFPKEIGLLRRLQTLYAFYISGPGWGQLPDEIGALSSLKVLNLGAAGLSGTIPPSIVNLTSLRQFGAPENRLTGSIPELFSPNSVLGLVDLAKNQLSGDLSGLGISSVDYKLVFALFFGSNRITGTVPAEIFSRGLTEIDFSSNQLSGQLPNDIFSYSARLIKLNDNLLNGTIPSKGLKDNPTLSTLILSNNALTGTIPPQFAQTRRLNQLELSNNMLTGNLDGWIRPPELPMVKLSFSASSNQFAGQLPFLDHNGLHLLDLSYNNLSGTIPMLPSVLMTLDLSYNSITGGLAMVAKQNNMTPVIATINLSHNNIRGSIPSSILKLGSLTSLNLAHNALSGEIPLEKHSVSALSSLDLSHNRLSGGFSEAVFAFLTALKLNDNRFTGTSFSIGSSRMSYLDISGNRFAFSASQFTRFPDLVSLIASNNSIYDNMDGFMNMPSLRVVDLSRNNLSGTLPLKILHQMYSRHLQQLFITNNRQMTTITTTTKEEGPWRTLQSQPSSTYPGYVNCFTLTFSPNSTTTQFLYDENLFDWSQCDCMQGYYGIPPLSCFTCPSSSTCQARHITVPKNRFLYPVKNSMDNDDNKKETPTGPLLRHRLPFESESCLVSISAQQSNCVGIGVDIDDVSSSYMMSMVPGWNKRQCKDGSEGRLCSRCQCGNSPLTSPSGISIGTHESNSISSSSFDSSSPCFFMRGVRCSRCHKVFEPSQSLGMIGGVLLLLIMIVTVIMYLVLRSRRQKRDLKWENLPLWRRIFNRLVDASSFGLVSLVIMFVQLLSEITHWHEYALQSFTKLLNGDSESLGLICLFPTILSQPLASLALRLVLPLAVILVVGVSICLAQIGHQLVSFKSKRHFNRLDSSSNPLLESNDSYSSIIMYGVDDNRLADYPVMALFTSTTISALQFFYFGTALAATEYFFSTVQSGTGVAYVQAHPWLLYHDAAPMRHLSIPWLVVIVFGLPFAFIVTCIQFRHKINSPLIVSYTGSLFRKFSIRCYWWEIINVTKKLTIALLIRGIPASNPFQTALITLTIAASQLLQVLLTPWRRRLENVMDPVGGTLLILSLFAASMNSDSNGVTFMILTLDGVYVVSLVVMICYHAITEETEYERVWKASQQSPSGIDLKEVDEPLLRHPIGNMLLSSDSTDESNLETPTDSEIDN